jgi:hypothetical protein
LSVKRETYKNLTFNKAAQWSNTHYLSREKIQRSRNFWKPVAHNKEIVRRGHASYKSNGVVVRLRVGYDFSIEGEISLFIPQGEACPRPALVAFPSRRVLSHGHSPTLSLAGARHATRVGYLKSYAMC